MINIHSLPETKLLTALYEAYYSSGADPDAFASAHWRYHGSKIRVKIDSRGDLTECMGSGFGLVRQTNIFNRMLHCLCNASYLLSLPDGKAIVSLARKARAVLSLLDSYLSYESFRQIYSLRTIMKNSALSADEAFDLLVIGDGYGFLSALIKSVYPRARITLVDLGKVLFFQALNLQRIYPNYSHAAIPASGGDAAAVAADLVYCPAENIGQIRGKKFKLIINIASMQEMDYPTIERYFSFIRENALDDNLFYCCNRERKELIGGNVIEFLKYPWAESDTHIIDEYCAFYRYYLSWAPPFMHNFEGPIRHRLTRLKTRHEGA